MFLMKAACHIQQSFSTDFAFLLTHDKLLAMFLICMSLNRLMDMC